MAAPAQSRRRTRRPRAERQAEILDSARQIFSDKGYGAATVAEIAAAAGVVEGTVYSYFESKRALLIAVMKSFFEELIADTESGLRAVRGTENQLRFVIRRHLETFTSDPGLCRVIIREARPDVALYDEVILDLNRRYTGLALSVLEEGVEKGSLRENIVPSVIRDLIYGGIEHAVWRFVFTDGDLEIGMLADQLADAILGGIAPDIRVDVATRPIANEEIAVRLERAVLRLESTLERSALS
jgi:AcrR family transcriptional regulator